MDLIQVYSTSSSSEDDNDKEDAGNGDVQELFHSISKKKKRKRSYKESCCCCCSCSNKNEGSRQKALQVSLVSIDDDSLGNRNRSNNRSSNSNNNNNGGVSMHFKRRQPHVIGNWSGHLYLKVKIPENSHDANSSCGQDHREYDMGLNNVILNTLDHFVMTMNNENNPGGLAPKNNHSQQSECGISDGDAVNVNTSISRNAVEKVVVVSHIPMHQHSNIFANEMHQDDDSSSSSSSSSLESDHDCTTAQSECHHQHQQHHLHISLSRPFYLQKQSIESFITELKKLIAVKVQYPIHAQIPISSANANVIHNAACSCTRTTTNSSTQEKDLDTSMSVAPSYIQIPKAEILSNDEKTRSFLTIPLHTDEMLTKKKTDQCATATTVMMNEVGIGIPHIVDIIDSVMVKYGQEKYYQDPKFHISIASWHYNEGILEKWQDYCRHRQCVHGVRVQRNENENDDDDDDDDDDVSSKDGLRLRGSDALLSIVLRGMHCDFGTVEKHFIPFG